MLSSPKSTAILQVIVEKQVVEVMADIIMIRRDVLFDRPAN